MSEITISKPVVEPGGLQPEISLPDIQPREQAGPVVDARTPLEMVESRLRTMRTAIQRSGGILLLDNFTMDGLRRPEAPRQEAKAGEKVAQGLAAVKKAFDQLDALGPDAFKKVTLGKKTSRAVENAYKSLNDLDKRLDAFEKAAGESTATRNLRDASMARLCELSRFVGTLQAEAMTEEQLKKRGLYGFEPLKKGASVRAMLSDLAITMHGNEAASCEVSAEAEEIFADIQKLKDLPQDRMNPQAARVVADLRERATALNKKVEDILAPPAPGQSKSMPGEPALFRAIDGYVRTAIDGLDRLTQVTPRDTVTPMLRETFPVLDNDLLAIALKMPPFLKDVILPAHERNEGLKLKHEAGALTGQDVLAASEANRAALGGEKGRVAADALRVMREIMANQYNHLWPYYNPDYEGERHKQDAVFEAKKNIGRRLEEADGQPAGAAGQPPAEKYMTMADELLAAFLPVVNPRVKDDEKSNHLKLASTMLHGNLLGRTALSSREERAAAEAVDRSKDPIPVQRYLPLLFEHKARLSLLIDAAMHNIAPEHLELRPETGTLKSSGKLGEGAVNAVYLCRYADAHGQPLSLVFKPEAQARSGLDSVRLADLGYSKSIQTARLNMASSTVAELLGTPRVLAKSSLGFVNGEDLEGSGLKGPVLGLFMSHAKGKTPQNLKDGDVLQRICKRLGKEGKWTMWGNLQRELCRLEWADLLSGQGDRHVENYLVDINPRTAAVTVTGIDNDLSFSERMVGITTIDMTDMAPDRLIAGIMLGLIKQRCVDKGGESPPYELKEGRLLLHTDQAAGASYQEIKNLTGLNQAFRPAHIDKETYDNLMRIETEAYRESLRPFLSVRALEAAVRRLESAKDHAGWLMERGRCLEGSEWREAAIDLFAEAQDAARDKEKDGMAGEMGLEFFARDFARFFDPNGIRAQ